MRPLFKQFVEKWGDLDTPLRPCSEASIAAMEQRLGTKLPDIYRAFLLEVGGLNAYRIYDDIESEDRQHVPELCHFNSPEQIIEEAEGWRDAGLPENMIPFADDICGNLLCFEKQSGPSEDGPVYDWDHDVRETSEVAPSFLSIIEGYVEIEKPE